MVFLETQFHVRTHDLWHGYILENQGLIVEPRITVTLAGQDQSIVYFGAGQSFHSAQSLSSPTATADAFFEANFFVGTGRPVGEKWWADLMFLTLTSPNGGFGTNQELGWTMRYTGLPNWNLGDQAVQSSPYAKVAWELDGQIDAGTEEGTYLEIGLDNRCDQADGSRWRLPIRAGFSLDRYYELGGSDQTFGFFEIGLAYDCPLTWIPAEQGRWTFHAGVHYLRVSDNVVGLTTGAITGGDKDVVHGSVGLSMNY
ncbi:MAG: hypothetical protein R3236_09855 [Phycisphaeraceae bacterium]|nr:hypothetical protein [Phycisphaeraceae bacterium]